MLKDLDLLKCEMAQRRKTLAGQIAHRQSVIETTSRELENDHRDLDYLARLLSQVDVILACMNE
jgi:hypothetical protein